MRVSTNRPKKALIFAIFWSKPVRIGSRNLISAASSFKFVHVSQNKNSCMNGLSTIRWSVKFAQLFTRTHRYGRSAIKMLFCKISEHILDEILISGKVQIIVSADYFTFGRNRSSKDNTDIRIFKLFQDRFSLSMRNRNIYPTRPCISVDVVARFISSASSSLTCLTDWLRFVHVNIAFGHYSTSEIRIGRPPHEAFNWTTKGQKLGFRGVSSTVVASSVHHHHWHTTGTRRRTRK